MTIYEVYTFIIYSWSVYWYYHQKLQAPLENHYMYMWFFKQSTKISGCCMLLWQYCILYYIPGYISWYSVSIISVDTSNTHHNLSTCMDSNDVTVLYIQEVLSGLPSFNNVNVLGFLIWYVFHIYVQIKHIFPVDEEIE